MNYFEYNQRKTAKRATDTSTYQVIDIDSYLVTEENAPDDSVEIVLSPELEARIEMLMKRAIANPANDRHGWACTCVACRIDRGDDE